MRATRSAISNRGAGSACRKASATTGMARATSPSATNGVGPSGASGISTAGTGTSRSSRAITKSVAPKFSKPRTTSAGRSRRCRRTARWPGVSRGNRSSQSRAAKVASRSTDAPIASSSSAKKATSAAGGSPQASARPLAARTAAGTCSRSSRSRARAVAPSATRCRANRSTSCRQADCAPKPLAVSAANTVARLSSKRTGNSMIAPPAGDAVRIP